MTQYPITRITLIEVVLIQSDQKFTKPVPDTLSLCSAQLRRLIHSEQEAFSVTFVKTVSTFDGYRPNYRHLAPKVDRNGFCVACFLVTEKVYQTKYRRISGTEESENVFLKSFWQVK
jgi:hypothetical protein